MHRAMLKACAGLVLCAGLVGCGGDDEDAEASVPRTIALVEHIVSETVTDTGEMGDSVGDVLTFANEIYEVTNKTKVGSDQGYCLRVTKGEAWECNWTVFLGEGQLTVEGPFFDAKGSTLAITGGTGTYSGARGTMDLTFRDNPAELNFIYHVTTD